MGIFFASEKHGPACAAAWLYHMFSEPPTRSVLRRRRSFPVPSRGSLNDTTWCRLNGQKHDRAQRSEHHAVAVLRGAGDRQGAWGENRKSLRPLGKENRKILANGLSKPARQTFIFQEGIHSRELDNGVRLHISILPEFRNGQDRFLRRDKEYGRRAGP